MSVSWELLAGDTAEFAVKMALHADPDDGKGSRPEESASWGGIQFIVRGRNLCAHSVGGGDFQECRWYLLPILEWFAENWDPLFHEENLPISSKGDNASELLEKTKFPKPAFNEKKATEQDGIWSDWWARHCILSAREGGFLPDVCFRRCREKVELSWRESPIAGAPSDFRFSVPQGVERISPKAVAEPLYQVCLEACKQLAARLPESTRVKRLQRSFISIQNRSGA